MQRLVSLTVERFRASVGTSRCRSRRRPSGGLKTPPSELATNSGWLIVTFFLLYMPNIFPNLFSKTKENRNKNVCMGRALYCNYKT